MQHAARCRTHFGLLVVASREQLLSELPAATAFHHCRSRIQERDVHEGSVVALVPNGDGARLLVVIEPPPRIVRSCRSDPYDPL